MRNEETIFAEALCKPPQERPDFLDEACANALELRQQVEALLAAHECSHGVLESPPAGIESAGGNGDSHRQTQLPSEQAGSLVGPYKLLEQIGEGGMGVVFMAEQLRPVRRKVALKILKPGLDSKQVIARLEAERQALAMMDHPNIAKVFDAGATDTGRPYFVMELVRGIPITQYCDEHRLTPRERLELFVQVCQAVQHAHQKGVIHRDLKPSNVLVTLQDGKAMPKVIDFGVAKATAGQRLTDQTLFTEFRQLIGTPLYMSPEQAEMSALLDLDTRSDVYSLGVLLYELLTGSTPFDKQRLAKAAFDEVRRIIREEEPPRPSTRISTLGEILTAVCARRQTDPNKLGSVIRGELDWIVMRALEKDRTRRYETANGLARDVERYLTDQPVEACPPSRAYRFRKFARRNKAVMMTAAVIAAVLIVATLVSAWQAMRATNANDREFAQRQQAEAVANLLESLFNRLDPLMARSGGDELRSSLLAQLDRTAADLNPPYYRGDPRVRARLRYSLGTTALGLGETVKAEALRRAAMDEQARCGDTESDVALSTMNNLARAWDEEARYNEAIALLERVRDLRISTLGPDEQDTLATINCLATAYNHAGRYPQAISLLEQVRDKTAFKLGPEHRETLIALNNLGTAYTSGGRYQEAIKTLEQARDGEIRTLGPDSPHTLTTLNNVALAFWYAGRSAEAIALFEQVRDRAVRKLGPDASVTLKILNNLAAAYQDVGRVPEAIALLEHVRDRRLEISGADHPSTFKTLNNLAGAYLAAGRTDDAMKLLEQVRGPAIKKLGASHPDTLQCLSNLAFSYLRASRINKAIDLWEQVKDQQIAKIGAEHPDTLTTLDGLAGAYEALDRIGDAEPLRIRSLNGRRKKLGDLHPETLQSIKSLASLYASRSRYSDAEPLWRELSQWSLDHPAGLPDFKCTPAKILPNLSACYRALGQQDKAAEWEKKLKAFQSTPGK